MRARRLVEADAEALRALRLQALVERPIDFSFHLEEESVWPMERWRKGLTSVVWVGVEQQGGEGLCALCASPHAAAAQAFP